MDFGSIVGGLWGAVQLAAPLLGVGAGIKHVEHIPLLKQTLGHITKRIPNDTIPVFAAAVDVVTGGTGLGGLAAVGVHQAAKVGLRALFGLFGGRAVDAVKKHVGPGDALSI